MVRNRILSTMRIAAFLMMWFALSSNQTFAQGWQEPQLQFSDFATDKECYLYNVKAKRFYTEANTWGTQGSVGEEGLKVKFVKNGDAVKITNYSNVKSGWRTSFIATNGAIYVDAETATECYWKVVPVEGKVFKLMISAPNQLYNQENYPGAMMGLDLFEDPYRTNLAAFLFDAEEPGEGLYLTDWAVATTQDYNTYQTEVATYRAAMKLGQLLDEAHANNLEVSEEEAVYNNTASTLAQLQTAIGSAIYKILAPDLAQATSENPLDLTAKFVTNPDYANNDNVGWKGTVQPGIDANNNMQNAEFFNTNFDTYQDIINLPEGTYRVSLQGFYRAGLEAESYNYKLSGSEPLNAELYVTASGKTSTTKIQSVFTGASTQALGVDGEIHSGDWWVPNNISASAAYFAAGYYNGNSVEVKVTSGKLRIGLRKSTTIRRDWVMLDNWKLEYLGKD